MTDIKIRRSDDRGRADFGWLKGRHSFSFGEYYDPAHMGFRTLRVINEDRIAVGGGFPTHPHRDMEIFSYVVEGELEHRDSMGNGRTLKPGQIQLMSAGRGVTHSEYNPGKHVATHMLQIWIQPRERGLKPGYTEWHPKPEHETAAKVLVISADGREGSALIHQDADVYRIRLKKGERVSHELADGRGLWLQIIRGSATLNGMELQAGDGASAEAAGAYAVEAVDGVEALLFDLK
ncbi:MAG TPA: pirin family protein [Kiritimatiellia bacterium]|nr:pirin family protein [Kiritimatiellia bacterium]